MTTVEEPLVEMRLRVRKSTHEKFTRYQLKLASKKLKRLTQEEVLEFIIEKLKV